MAQMYKVQIHWPKREYEVKATSLLAAGWTFLQHLPPGVRAGVNDVIYTAKAGHPWFPWEGRISEKAPRQYCRVRYRADDGTEHEEQLTVMATSPADARKWIEQCTAQPLLAFESQSRPFDDDDAVRMPADRELYGDAWLD